VVNRPGDDASLIARAKRGEPQPYEEIVERYQAIAFRVAWLITASAADAEEATQDAFLKAHRALGRFREGAPFRPWLLGIVANEARNRRVAAQRRERLALRVLEEERAPSETGSPESALLDADRRAQLVAALRRLEERDRVAIACRYFLDLSEAEMAAALDCRRGTVKSRLSRALARLRTEMEGERD
jgi:RNA polymerase sigma-70 factor (ECF subfamily)